MLNLNYDDSIDVNQTFSVDLTGLHLAAFSHDGVDVNQTSTTISTEFMAVHPRL